MNCKDFHLHINDFINDKITDEKTLEQFVEHANSCHDCMDELVIYYAVNVGLDSDLESGKIDFDFEKKLNKILSDYEMDFDDNYRTRFFGRMFFLSGEIILLITVVLIILHYMRFI